MMEFTVSYMVFEVFGHIQDAFPEDVNKRRWVVLRRKSFSDKTIIQVVDLNDYNCHHVSDMSTEKVCNFLVTKERAEMEVIKLTSSFERLCGILQNVE